MDNIAFPKNPDTKIFKSKFFFNVAAIPPNTESKAAIIAIAKYPVYVYGMIGAWIPISAPTIQPIKMAIPIIVLPPLLHISIEFLHYILVFLLVFVFLI